LTIHNFSIGGLQGWQAILLGLLGAGVFLFSGRQDLGFRARAGAVLGYFLALLLTAGVIWLAIEGKIWAGALLGAVAFFSEAWLVRHWWRQDHSV
jgi:hypothetical protein